MINIFFFLVKWLLSRLWERKGLFLTLPAPTLLFSKFRLTRFLCTEVFKQKGQGDCIVKWNLGFSGDQRRLAAQKHTLSAFSSASVLKNETSWKSRALAKSNPKPLKVSSKTFLPDQSFLLHRDDEFLRTSKQSRHCLICVSISSLVMH